MTVKVRENQQLELTMMHHDNFNIKKNKIYLAVCSIT